VATTGGTECLGRVLEDRDAVLGAHGLNARVVGGLAIDIHGEHSGWQSADPRTTLEELRELDRVQIPRERLRVDEDGASAGVVDSERGGPEGHRRHDDLVTRADSHSHEREVDACGPRAEGDGVLDTHASRHLRLERLHVRPEGRHPAGAKRVEDELLL